MILTKWVLIPLWSSEIDSLKEAVIPVSAKILRKKERLYCQYLLLAHLWINDTEKELLFLGALCCWQVSGQETFERVCDFIACDGGDILKCLFCSSKWLVCSQLNHLGKSLDISDCLLDLGELTTSLIELFFFEKSVSGGAFK